MRAFNSLRIIVPILVVINCAAPRSVDHGNDQVIDGSIEIDNSSHHGGKLSSETVASLNNEGIRRFDAEVADSGKLTDLVNHEKLENDVIAMKVITIEDHVKKEEREVGIVDADVNHGKRSVKRKLDSVETEMIDDAGKEKKSEESVEGMNKEPEKVHLRHIPELIPVKVDHIDPYEINHDIEEIARKSLTVVDDDEEIEEERKEEIRSERSSQGGGVSKEERRESAVQKWKEAAMTLQGQIKNRTFLNYLKEQATEVLPEIPKFTEDQLLEALKTISEKKSSEAKVSYIGDVNGTILNESQLEIFKCAEGLVAEKERQSFTENMFECIRGLSFLNCMRIFIWPIIADRVPETIMQSFPTLPIEVSLSDLLPGRQEEKPKSIRASGAAPGIPQQRLITPELVVSNILREALEANPTEENVPTYIDPKNETLSKLLTPGQLNILKMAEKFLPKSARQEYSNRMYSCVRRFEYFSCVKYFAWPMIKQHFPALPEFPDYESWYPSTVSLYPGYPIVPFPDLSDNDGQLPEVIEADAIKNRTPRPETLIVQLLRNTLSQQPRQPAVSTIPALPNIQYLSEEQLASLQLAEQLVPVPYREEFITKTMQCIREYNYLICTKYSMWPALKTWQPNLPAYPDFGSAISSFFGSFITGLTNKPDKPNFSELWSQLPFGSWPIWPGSGGSTPSGGSQGSGGASGGSGGGSGGTSGGAGSGSGSSGGSSGSITSGGSSGSDGSSGAGSSGTSSSVPAGGGSGGSQGSAGGQGGSSSSGGSGSWGGGSGSSQGPGSGQGGSAAGVGTFPSVGSISWGGSSGGGQGGSTGGSGLVPIGGTITWGGGSGGGQGGSSGGSGSLPSGGSISWGGSSEGSQGSGGGQSGSSGSSGSVSSGGGSGGIQGSGNGQGSSSGGSGSSSGGSISWGGGGGGSPGSGGQQGGSSGSSGSGSWSGGSGGSQGSGNGQGSSPGGSGSSSGGSISWGGGGGGSPGSGGQQGGSSGSSGSGSWSGGSGGSQGSGGGQGSSSGGSGSTSGGSISWGGGGGGSPGSGGQQGGSSGSSGSGSWSGGSGGSQGSGGGQGSSSGGSGSTSGGSISWGGGGGGSQGSGAQQGASSGSSGSLPSGGSISPGGTTGGPAGSGGGQGGSLGGNGSGSWGGSSGVSQGSSGGQGGSSGGSGSFPSGGTISWGGGGGGSQESGGGGISQGMSGGQGGSSGGSGSFPSGGSISWGGVGAGSQGSGGQQSGLSGSSGSGSWNGGSGVSQGTSGGQGGPSGGSGLLPIGGTITWGGGSGGGQGGSGGIQGGGGGQGSSSGVSGSSSGGNISWGGGGGGSQGSGGGQGGSWGGIGSGSWGGSSGVPQGSSGGQSGSSVGGGSFPSGGSISWGGGGGGSQGSGGSGISQAPSGQGGSSGGSGSLPSGGSISWGGGGGGSQGSGSQQPGSSNSGGSLPAGGSIPSGGAPGGSQGSSGGQSGSAGSNGSGSWSGSSGSLQGTTGGQGGYPGGSGSFPSGGSISSGGSIGGTQGSDGQQSGSGSSGSGSWGGGGGTSQGTNGGQGGWPGISGSGPSEGSISWGGSGGSENSGGSQGSIGVSSGSSGANGPVPGTGSPASGSGSVPSGSSSGSGNGSSSSGDSRPGLSGGNQPSSPGGSISGSGTTGGSSTSGSSGTSSGSVGGASGSSGGSAGHFPGTGIIPSFPNISNIPHPSGGSISWGGSGGNGGSGGYPGSIPSWGGSSGSSGGSHGGGISSIPSGGTISWGGSNNGESSGGGISPIPSGGTISWGGNTGSGGTSPSGASGSGSTGGISTGGSSGSSGNVGGSSGSSGLGAIIAGSGGGGGTYAPKPSKSNAEDSQAFLDRISMGGIAKDPEQALYEKSMEAKIIEILYSLRYSIPSTPLVPLQLDRHMIFLTRLSNEQLTILGLAKSIIPPPARPDLISRSLGCLQSGSDFMGCTKTVIWPFLSLYVANLPAFPEESAAVLSTMIPKHASESDFVPETPVGPSPYFSLIGQTFQLPYGHFIGQPVQAASRSSLRSEISAKADDQPIISVTDTRFVPIYSDHPETVILKILTAMADSIEHLNPSEYHSKVPAFIDLHSTLNSTLNEEQEKIIKIAEHLIPETSRQTFFNGMLNCLVKSNSFQFCSRDILWPALAEHYPRLPSFPSFQENLTENRNSLKAESSVPISEIDVKTGQHGDTLVTITDTRFVPLFGEHPEEVIMKLLKGIHNSSPNQINTPASSIAKSPSFTTSFSNRQSDILVIAENLLPESIREIFIMRMTDCVRDNAFLDCTRDIAWPTIGQFYPRLASFPNFGTLPSLAEGKPQQPTLLPPNLEPTAPMSEMPRIIHPEANQIHQSPESLESRIEGILNQVALLKNNHQPGLSYLNTEEPITAALITEEQARIIRMTEGLVPEGARPMFIIKMMDCIRGNGFPICTQAVAWPTLRQFLPNIPEFPGISNFIPELPSFSEFAANYPQLPNIPSLQQFGLPQVPQLQRNSLKSIQEIPGAQHEVLLPGIIASVGSAPVVPAFPGQPTDILINISEERVTLPEADYEINRKRRHVINLLEEETNSEINIDKLAEPALNITEPELLQLLVNITQTEEEQLSELPEKSVVDSLNSTANSSLTYEQTAILGMVEKLGLKNTRGLMSQVIGCITSLSFIRCIGIFVWPLITSAVPSMLGLPFGRSTDEQSDDLFGSSFDDLEKELWERKEEMERKLLDWYKSLTEEKFETNYGFLRFEGYGDGEIGIKFAEKREGRAKIKDHKNLPSILTIISEIMEDVLETGRPSNQKGKKENRKKGKSLVFPLDDESERSNNDDQIISMFLDKLRNNVTDEDLEYGNRRLTSDDAYRAFEVLFGPRLKARLVDKFEQLYENKIEATNENHHHRVIPLEQQEKKANLFKELHEEQENLNRKKSPNESMKSAFTIHLPKLDDEIMSRKMTNSLANLARHMNKNTMMQMMPSVGFLLTFLLQMALAHARAAASMATMMSNMAMGTAMFSLVRQALFGQTNHPKIKYVYDTEVNAPGISWPQG